MLLSFNERNSPFNCFFFLSFFFRFVLHHIVSRHKHVAVSPGSWIWVCLGTIPSLTGRFFFFFFVFYKYLTDVIYRTDILNSDLKVFIHKTLVAENHPTTREIRDLLGPGRHRREPRFILHEQLANLHTGNTKTTFQT